MIRKSIIVFAYFFVLINFFCPSLTRAENEIDKYKFYVYLIYSDLPEGSMLLYSEEQFGDIVNIKRKMINIRKILQNNTYIISSDYLFNAYQFELESVETEKSQNFYFDFAEGKNYYFLIGFDDKKNIELTQISENQGKLILNKLHKVED